MSEGSNIEWTDATWNPVVGCSRVSAGCDHCYAVGMTRRLEGMAKMPGLGRKQNYVGLTVRQKPSAIERGVGVNGWHFNGAVRCVDEALDVPFGWKSPRRVFVNSMSDLFHPKVPFEFIDRVFAVMAMCPRHTFQVLTKRPERMADYFARPWAVTSESASVIYYEKFARDHGPPPWPSGLSMWPVPNVWLGTSCEDQAAADERIPHLLRCPAAVRFLSCEPLIGPVDLSAFFSPGFCGGSDREYVYNAGIGWVIIGGESGTDARPCSINWINSIESQCLLAGVPLFVKQLGSNPVVTSGPSSRDLLGERTHCERFKVNDRKGADPSEWPVHLQRHRDFPTETSHA